jgi:cytoskeletal protein RodZ
MQTVGHQLRTRREQRDQTLDAAARATRIPRHALRALEDDRFDDLAAPVYARGFLRNYAAWLGLDADGVLASYEEQQAVRQGLALGVEPSEDEGPVRLPGYFQASPGALRALTPAQTFLLLVTAATLVVFMLSVNRHGEPGGGVAAAERARAEQVRPSAAQAAPGAPDGDRAATR